ncbi:hypothetical protein KL932_004951 [Ogataea haglerorum]|uniref:Uncharacterized protein n=1 Tax=Ogataea haglerorum TaxID=1937702 RepID=A0ABQ7RGN7_9ASCO|nr:hypothetical protein KL932_004951 [Ogataea haglerorum]KAG7765321.1 hypothetical protein KL946_002378 [Ogataea haglerorum]KAG7809640.1 hypothetical protein KL924_002602 [Ogataea haglerorum]
MESSPVYLPPSSTAKFHTEDALSSSQISESGRYITRKSPRPLLTQNQLVNKPKSPERLESKYHPARSPTQTTPRTVRLINYDNYSYSPTNFSVFPDFDLDTLDVSQNYDLIGNSNYFATSVDPGSPYLQKPSQHSHYLFHPLANEDSSIHRCSLPNLPASDPIVEYPSLYDSSSTTCLNTLSSPPMHPFSLKTRSCSETDTSKIQFSSFFELDELSDVSDPESNEFDDEDDNYYNDDTDINEAQSQYLSPPLMIDSKPEKLEADVGCNPKKFCGQGFSKYARSTFYSQVSKQDKHTLLTPTSCSPTESSSGIDAPVSPPNSMVSRKRLFAERDDKPDTQTESDHVFDSLVSDLENKAYSQYRSSIKIPLPPLSQSRYDKITELAANKNLDMGQVDDVLKLFKLRNFDLKLKLLSRVLGQRRGEQMFYPEHTSDKGLVLTESNDGSLSILAKTYAGHEDSSSIIENSIISSFKDIKEFAIYFRQPNDTGSKTRKTSTGGKKQRLGKSRLTDENGHGSTIYIKRPLNSFMLYRTSMVKAIVLLSLIDSLSSFVFRRLQMQYSSYDSQAELEYLKIIDSHLTESLAQELRQECVIHKYNHHLLIQIVAVMWSTELNSVKKTFISLAQSEKKIHAQCYPNYKYHPQRKG